MNGKLTAAEVGGKLGVSDGTIRGMCRRGTIKAERVANPHCPEGSWVIDYTDFEAYLKARDKPQCYQLSETDKAYIAGLCDGEGCLTAFITRKKNQYSTIYYIQIIVVEEEPIQWLKEVTGVGYVFQRDRQKDGWQDLWGWKTCNTPACEVLEQILPYLKIKRRQAEIFLALRDRVRAMRAWRVGKGNNIPMPREEWIERQKLIDEIHRLNKRTGKVRRTEFSSAQ